MKVSANKVDANRRNAQRSTGPRTLEGKQRSSANALKHGAYSRAVVLPNEDQAAYDAMYAALNEEFEPATSTELHLVQDLADYRWRLIRAGNADTGRHSELHDKHRAVLTQYHKSIRPLVEEIDPEDFELRILGEASHQPSLGRLMSNESVLHRLYMRTLSQLLALQKGRDNRRQPIELKQDIHR